MTERRSRRSHVRTEALTMFLEEQRRRLRLRGLIVTTRAGRLLGSAGTTGRESARRSSTLGTWELRAGDLDVIVLSHGGRLSHELGMGIRRILTS